MLRKLYERFKCWLVGWWVVPPMLVDLDQKDVRRHAIVISNNGVAIPILVRRRMPLFYFGPRLRKALGLRPVSRSASAYIGRKRRDMTKTQYRRYLKAMMAGLRGWWHGPEDRAKRKGVLVFIYGGNENPRKTVDISITLYPKILRDGYYPVFICWDSSLKRAYAEQLLRIRSGLYSRATGDSGYFLLADIVNSATHWLPACAFFLGLLGRSSRWAKATEVDPKSFLGPKIAQGTWRPGFSVGDVAQMILGFVFQVFIILPLTGTYVPRAWENLLRRTRAMFRAPREFDPVLAQGQKMPEETKYSPAEGALALFLDELAGTAAQCGNMTVTFVAHSMGSMISNEALHYRSDLPYESLVYMAPACSVRDFADAVDPIIRDRKGKTDAYILTLHPKVEAGREWHGWIGGSVLEWLEGSLTPPHAPLDRTLGKWDNALRTCHIYKPDVREQIHIKSFSYDGRNRKKPYEHDHFHDPDLDPPFWSERFWV